MPENDIYNNQARYERFLDRIDDLAIPLEKRTDRKGVRKYYCKNESNVKYYRKLNKIFESKDTSYIRRLRAFRVLLIITHATKKDLKDCDRDDINSIVAFAHTVNNSPKTKEDFIKDTKFFWKVLFPEKDEKSRIDETIMPYPVRHLSGKIDKSKMKLRNDKLTFEEYEKIVNYFDKDPQMQCYLTMACESLGRPQEMCYRKIKDIEFYDNYAKIWVSSHGKEGVKFLQCIDSLPYLLKWYEKHPYKNESEAYLFLSNGRIDQPLAPVNIGKKLRNACENLHITKRITPYSIKRNGVTFARLRGDSDVEIQHRAGWTSTKQLQTYDQSNGEDSLKKELAKRGLINDKGYQGLMPKTKECLCGAVTGFAEKICPKCKRMLDKNIIKEDMKAEQEIKDVFSFALKNPNMSFIEIMDNFRGGLGGNLY